MQPNILYIFSDQHRFCDTGFSGNTEVETPNLDALAKRGAWFSSCYSTCPLCVPARGSILTGCHALHHGAVANDLPVRTTLPSIADVLNRSGYATGYIGKWHLGGVPRDKYIPQDERLGFSFWNGQECSHNYMSSYYDDTENCRHTIEGYEPTYQTELAISFLERHKSTGRPWALWLSFGPPHEPYDALPPEELAYWKEKHLTLRKNVDAEHLEFQYGPMPDLRASYAGYYGHIRLLDREIGRLMNWLEVNQLTDDTIVVYTSDHGDMLGSHGFLNKQLYFEESAKVPFIACWPGKIPAGKRTQLIGLVDHAPTILGLVQAEMLPDADGSDQSPVLLDPTAKGQAEVYLHSYVPCHQALFRALPSWRCLVTREGYKYVTDQSHEPVALYDLNRDPLEEENLLGQFPELQRKLDCALTTQVEQYDGYRCWEDLLRENELWGNWEESEAYFRQLFAKFAKRAKTESI